MNKTLLLHELLNMVNKDKWTEIYNPDNHFNVNPHDYDDVDDYLGALRRSWKEALDPDGVFETYIDVSEYDEYDSYEAEIERYVERQSWYRKEFEEPDINPCDYEKEEDYLNALRKRLKEKYDRYDDCEALDPLKFDSVREYQYDLDEKIEWKEKYDPNDDFFLDPSPYDFEDDYLDDIREEWKKKYDPKATFWSIDPSDYADVNEYAKAIELRQEWMDEYDPEEKYDEVDPCDYDDEDDYLDALRECWKKTHDPDNEFEDINPDDYFNGLEYLDALREAWKEEYDPFDEHDDIDVEDYDSLEDYQEAIEE